MTECGYHHSPFRSFHSARNEMIDSYDEDHLKAVENGAQRKEKKSYIGGLISKGFNRVWHLAAVTYSSIAVPPTTGWWIRPNLVITQCDSAIGDRSAQNLLQASKQPSLYTLLTSSISTSHYCNCYHSKWWNDSMGRAANCILCRPPQ